MSDTPRTTSSFPRGRDLRQNLQGSFTAHARGLLATEFALRDSDGEELGRLRLGGATSAELRSGDYAATFEASGRRYRMVADHEEVLCASTRRRSINELEVQSGGRTYEARIGFLRNLATASYPESGERAVSLSGSLAGRSYEAHFAAEDERALPVAVFLLWHLITHRRRAYRKEG